MNTESGELPWKEEGASVGSWAVMDEAAVSAERFDQCLGRLTPTLPAEKSSTAPATLPRLPSLLNIPSATPFVKNLFFMSLINHSAWKLCTCF